HMTNARVGFDDRVGVFGLGEGFVNEVGMRKVWLVNLHEVDAHEERLSRTRIAVEIVQCCLLDIAVQERDTNNTLLRRVDVFAADLELFSRRLTGIGRQRSLGYPLEHSS